MKILEDKSFEQYVKELWKNGTYADQITLEYTSEALHQSIAVIDESGDVCVGCDRSSNQMLYVGYIKELSHYVSLKPIM